MSRDASALHTHRGFQQRAAAGLLDGVALGGYGKNIEAHLRISVQGPAVRRKRPWQSRQSSYQQNRLIISAVAELFQRAPKLVHNFFQRVRTVPDHYPLDALEAEFRAMRVFSFNYAVAE
jgi:hypothetical protein